MLREGGGLSPFLHPVWLAGSTSLLDLQAVRWLWWLWGFEAEDFLVGELWEVRGK